uniref:Uncharacterized protein n=1 Tax=Pelagomonas calceolata TaxID=35677 RepID=A0A7S3ZML3_9STRA|mmetsp:Transcript_3659/g.11181  ORF Transcript_3659/g.11181 Transcript_3659/m.11181 type:complete len:611 (+) Transcript_3659:124-1956(+)
MVYQPEASAAAAARRRRSQRRVGFADQPPPSPDPTFPPPALEIDETDAVSAIDDGPLRAPEGEQLEIQIDKAQTPKVSKQHIAFGRVVRERQAVDAYVPPPKSLTLDPTTGAPIFRSPASKKKYGWTRTPKQTPTKVRRKVKRVMDSLPPPPSVSKYVDRAPDEESVIRPSDFESFGSPPPKAPPVFLTEPDEPRSPLSPVENTFPTGCSGSAVEAVRAKKERLQREAVQAKLDKVAERKLRFVREKRWKKWLVAVVSGRAAMELANRFLLKCIQEEDARLHEDAQRTLSRFYRSITRRRRLHAAATLLKARSLNVTIKIRVWKKRFASRKLQRFLKETAWAIRIRTARRKYFRAVRLFQRLFRDYGACTRARKLAMRRVWDACEGKAEETFATKLKQAAEAAAARAKEHPATFAEEVSMTAGPDPEIRDARQRAAAWRRRKAELVKAAQEKRRRKQRDEAIAKDEKTWNRTDAKFAALLAKTTGRQTRRRRRTAPVAAFAPVPVAARNAAFSEIIRDRRRAHGKRYASKTIRDDYRGTSKEFTMEEAFNLLGKPLPAAEAVRKAHEWPPVAFFVGLRKEVRRRYAAARASEDSLALARRKAEPVVAFEV